MSEAESTGKRGRKQGEHYANATEVFLAALGGPAELRKLEENKRIGYKTLADAKLMLDKAGKKTPDVMGEMMNARAPTSTAAAPAEIGDMVERIVSTDRGGNLRLFQIPMDPYSDRLKSGDHVYVSLEKNQIVVHFKKPKG